MSVRDQSASVTLRSLLQGFTDARYLDDCPVAGITSDSQQVNEGDVFIAQAGLTRHAIDFVPQAMEAGAVAVLYDEDDDYCRQRMPLLDKQYSIRWIPVRGLLRKAGQIAARYYADPSESMTLIGVTGTDGKTSVTHLLVQALSQLGKRVGSVGTLGYGVANRLKMTSYTTPDAITLQSILAELREQQCEYVVMEVSSHALEQYRVSGCEFDLALLTNLGSDHLDYHGTVENYAASKSALFAFNSLQGRVVNANDQLGQELLAQYAGAQTLAFDARVGQSEGNAVTLLHSRMKAEGLNIVADTPMGQVRVQSALVGSFNVDNLLAGIAALQLLGLAVDEIERGMQNLRAIPGRMEFYPSVGQLPAVVIDFAHTEQALQACLGALQGYQRGGLYCVFGCGGDRDQSKRPKMAAVAEQLADQVILTDDNPRYEPAQKIMQEILVGFTNPDQVRVIHDRRAAIETALHQAGRDGLVVIAGKGHEQFQIVGDQRIPFSDRQVVQQMREEAAL